MSNINQLNLNGTDYDIEAKDYSENGGIATALSGKLGKTEKAESAKTADVATYYESTKSATIADALAGKQPSGSYATTDQLNTKQDKINGAASTITANNLTASRALISNASGKVAVSSVTSTEMGYLSGVTSGVQAQLNAKASSSALSQEVTDRTNAVKDINDKINAMDLTSATTTANYVYGVTQTDGLVATLYSSWVTSVSDSTTDTKPATAKAMVTYIKNKIAGAFKFMGTKTVAQINALTLSSLADGSIYNLSDGGTITWNEGSATKTLNVIAGDNIIKTSVTVSGTTTHSWDAMSGFVDLSSYATTESVTAAVNAEATARANADTSINKTLNSHTTSITSLNNAKHTHNNKSTLDAITAAFTTALKNKLDGISSSAKNISITVDGKKATFSIS